MTLPHPASGLVAALAFGCVPASAQDAALRHAETLAIFDDACLGTLPGFGGAGQAFTKAGLAEHAGGYWVDDRRGLIAQTTKAQGDTQRGCFVALSGADIPALDAVLGQVVGGALDVAEVGVIDGPMPGNPSLYVVDREAYRITAVAAHVSRGYGMLSVTVQAPDSANLPWAGE
ncbi:MAG: hypothetical protein LJE68_02345 [Rhodobacter sp.]|nr:hypothetical protein [Rhodobacter sp.]